MTASGRDAPGELDAATLHPSGGNVLAFSGGPDSACLLHLLIQHGWGPTLRVVHVDHGLDAGSGVRAARARTLATELGADCRVERIAMRPPTPGGSGPEAAARHARYARLQALMQPGDHLLTAHHADDQVETVLLRLLRGAGPTGLAGMPALRALPPGWLGRPLLGWTRDRIRAYLARHGIRPVEDPSNRDPAPDRNHLRLRVLPAVAERWPGYRRAILGAAGWQRSAAGAVAMRARADWQQACRRSASGEPLLSVREWLELGSRRGRAAIRHWCSLLDLGEPPGERTAAFREQCASARRDAQPVLDWGAAQLHAWRGRIWLDRKPLPPVDWSANWSARQPLPLPAGGTLLWRGPAGAEDAAPWHLGPAPPGARLRLRPDGPRRRAADLMREAGVPPWRRHALPALTVAGELVALGPDWIDADWATSVAAGDAPLEWRARPRGLLPSGVGSS